MEKIRKGDIVGRKSYGKDILFSVKNIINTPKGKLVILRGIINRIEADSYIEDLEKMDKKYIKEKLEYFNKRADKRLAEMREYKKEKIYKNIKDKRIVDKLLTGKILHLDGDSCLDNKNSHWLINV